MSKAVFWDFDGTLAHARKLWTGSLHGALAEQGSEVLFDAVRAHTHTGFSWHTPELSYQDATGEAWWTKLLAHFEDLYDELGLDAGQRRSVNAAFRAKILSPDRYTLYPDALTALRACRGLGFRNYILSNNYPELSQVCEALGLGALLDGCVVSANVGYEKPRREIYEYALRLAGDPEDRWMVGDNPIADIQGAEALGIPAILVHAKEPAPSGSCATLIEAVDRIRSLR